jgi:hypothetical protein
MNDAKQHRQSLIQRYVDQTISNEELRELQEMLKSDVAVRNELLLYVRMDIAIRDYVLFHNYMDETSYQEDDSNRDHETTQRATPDIKALLAKMFAPLRVPASE